MDGVIFLLPGSVTRNWAGQRAQRMQDAIPDLLKWAPGLGQHRGVWPRCLPRNNGNEDIRSWPEHGFVAGGCQSRRYCADRDDEPQNLTGSAGGADCVQEIDAGLICFPIAEIRTCLAAPNGQRLQRL